MSTTTALRRARHIAILVIEFVFAPSVLAPMLFIVAAALSVLGVLHLFGHGWALLAGALNTYALAFSIAKGVNRG